VGGLGPRASAWRPQPWAGLLRPVGPQRGSRRAIVDSAPQFQHFSISAFQLFSFSAFSLQSSFMILSAMILPFSFSISAFQHFSFSAFSL
jgi:hypothetical protein